MKIDLIEHSGGMIIDAEYVSVGARHDSFLTLQVRKPGKSRLTHVEVGQVRKLVIGKSTLVPSSPNYREPRANELRTFIEATLGPS